MKDWVESLRMCSLFSDLPEERIRQALLPYGTLRQYAKDEKLIDGLEQTDWFGIVMEGHVQIVQFFSGGASSLMENLFPSYALGIDLVFTKSQRSPYCAVAAAPSQVMIFPNHILEETEPFTETERTLVWRNLLTMLSQANMRKHNRLSMLCQRGLRDRILSYRGLLKEGLGRRLGRLGFLLVNGRRNGIGGFSDGDRFLCFDLRGRRHHRLGFRGCGRLGVSSRSRGGFWCHNRGRRGFHPGLLLGNGRLFRLRRREVEGVDVAGGAATSKDGSHVQLLTVLHAGERKCVVGFTHNILLLSFF